MSGTFEHLEAERLAMDLVEAVYLNTQCFPKQEQYGLTNQRRAAVSVPSNIADGKGRSSDRELIQFLNQARGSIYELHTQLKIACRLHYLAPDTAHNLGITSSPSRWRTEWTDSGLPESPTRPRAQHTHSDSESREPKPEPGLTPATADCGSSRRNHSRSCSARTRPCPPPALFSRAIAPHLPYP